MGGNGFSMVGTALYSRGHPSRWAGANALARLTVDDVGLVIEPLPPWTFLRFPVIRIPLGSVSRADRLPLGGFRFVVPGVPEVDGMRFRGFVPGDDRLTTLAQQLAQRGLTGESVPVVAFWNEEFGNQVVARRPGLTWRDRGRRAYLESAVIFAVATAIAYWTGVFSGKDGLPIWLIPLVAVLVVARAIVGQRLRRK